MTLEELNEFQVKAEALRKKLLELTLEQNGRTPKGRAVAMGMLNSRQLIDDLARALCKQANEAALLRMAYMAARSAQAVSIH